MPQKDRAAIIVLAVAGVFALGLGLWQLNNNIRVPFLLKSKSLKQNVGQVSSSVLDLKSKDTDGDGLSDFDELYVYKSSPYLVDSDSDGDNDYNEVQAKTDPNCPKGRACEDSTISAPKQPLIGLNLPSSPLTNSQLSSGVSDDAKTKELLSSLTVDDIKMLLESAGMSKSQIKQFDDASLMKIYKEALDKTQ